MPPKKTPSKPKSRSSGVKKRPARKRSTASKSKPITVDAELQPMGGGDIAPTQDTNAPYPIPMGGPIAPMGGIVPKNDEVSFTIGKSMWKSKNFWGAICLFGLSALTLLGSVPQIAENPIFMSITSMCFALLWLVFRFTTNQPINPTINMPNPASMWRGKGNNNQSGPGPLVPMGPIRPMN